MQSVVLLTDPNAEHAITVVFGYILPIILTAFILSMTYYVVHRYIHVSKQKHPANLVSSFHFLLGSYSCHFTMQFIRTMLIYYNPGRREQGVGGTL